MATIDDVRAAFRRMVARETGAPIAGRIGKVVDGQWVIDVPTRGSFVFVTLDDGSVVEAANLGAASNIGGNPVWVVRESNLWKVSGVRAAAVDGGTGLIIGAGVGPHAHNRGTGNEYLIEMERLGGLTVIPTDATSVYVTVTPGFYMNAGALVAFEGGSINLRNYIPLDTDKQRWVMVCIDSANNQLTVATGTEVDFDQPLQRDDLAQIELEDTYVPLAGVRVYAGQLTLSWLDFMDARGWVGSMRSSTGLDGLLVDDDGAFVVDDDGEFVSEGV